MPESNRRASKEQPGSGFLAPCLATGLLFFVAGGAYGFLTGDNFRRQPIEQPIAFNHRLHVEEQGLDCEDCHPGCRSEVKPGIPDADTCLMCHAEAQGDSGEEARLVAMLARGESPAWRPLFRQPPHVFFSHRRHTAVAELDCGECHGDIGSSTTPPRLPDKLRMDDCRDCHLERGVSVSCSACHR
ncbi:MAG: hypothetical protein D6702_07565 [Planctomycetota bacterium]|nr:MAG: hypothetical protein D6702_07565 [Planctomycetota bacterium]